MKIQLSQKGIVNEVERMLALSPTFEHVLEFAFRMEAKLEKNRYKGNRYGWLKDSPDRLTMRIHDEFLELRSALNDGLPAKSVADEAADVANFAMMVADCVLEKSK